MFVNIAETVNFLWIEHAATTGAISVFVLLLFLVLALALAVPR